MTDRNLYAEAGENKVIQYTYRRILYSGRSPFQKIDVVESVEFGPMLFLDNVANSATRDEFIYHEVMVHPAMLAHPNPRSVCIIGGAEGATAREVLRHPVSRVVMVDIDGDLVNACQKHLPHYSQGAFDDPRLELIIGDGRKYLAEADEHFDVILIDLTDPVPDSPSVFLYTREFYQIIHDRLTDDGVTGLQGESLQPWRVQLHAAMRNTLGAVFPAVRALPYMQPCFHELHAILVASKGRDPLKVDWAEAVDARGLTLKYLSPEYLGHIFYVPAYVEQAYADHPDVLTDEKPYRFVHF
jgi:spermidine synthase